jgi:peptide deformylase
MEREPKLLPVRIIGDKVLKQKAKQVEKITPEIKELVADMFYTMYETDGIGLAAPQIGKSLRIFVIDIEWHHEDGKKNPLVFINPKFTFFEGETSAEEGCLSIPGIFEKVVRAEKVIIEATDLSGKRFTIETDDFLAVALQHEYDHLEGILFIDKVPKLRRMIHAKKLRELKSKVDENGVNIG